MTVADSQNLQRIAQDLVVEYRPSTGSPPDYSGDWLPIFGAAVERIVIERDSRPSSLLFWFPDRRWNAPGDPKFADQVRVISTEQDPAARSIMFCGFVTNDRVSFSGGNDTRSGHEQLGFAALDFRWLLDVTSPIMGQYARTIDNYTTFPTTPVKGEVTWLNGRRAIFNPDGVPNKDLAELEFVDSVGTVLYECPIFCNPSRDSLKADAWSARDMIRYLLSELNNKALDYFDFTDPADLLGLDHTDFDKVLNNVVVDTLNVAEAIEYICRQIGWGYRQDNFNDGTVTLVFYELGRAGAYVRSDSDPAIIQQLYAPAVDDNLAAAVAAGEKLLWSADIARDISGVVNKPWGYGAPEQLEFTAELVPAWLDSDLDPDTSGTDFENLFIIDADLQTVTSPDSHSFYRNYHVRGSAFKTIVGRKWALNETGSYTDVMIIGDAEYPYDRGPMFDFVDVIDDKFARHPAKPGEVGLRRFGPFNRRLLACLTPDNTGLNNAGIVVEFSFDGGATWQKIPCAIESLEDEAGILITEPNLSEMFDKAESKIGSGSLESVALNYWTSLCRDILDSNSFKDGEWNTRVRVTASVQMDKRLIRDSQPSIDSGSPFLQARCYDYSDNYYLRHRCSSSIFASDTPSPNLDQSGTLDSHIDKIRSANEDFSIAGRFVLERLWLGDGMGWPQFMIGDVIKAIFGRDADLSASWNESKRYPEIVRIEYLPQKQQTVLFTRDLRFSAS